MCRCLDMNLRRQHSLRRFSHLQILIASQAFNVRVMIRRMLMGIEKREEGEACSQVDGCTLGVLNKAPRAYRYKVRLSSFEKQYRYQRLATLGGLTHHWRKSFFYPPSFERAIFAIMRVSVVHLLLGFGNLSIDREPAL